MKIGRTAGGGVTVYMPEFVCGIGFTLLAEVFLLFLWYLGNEENRKKKK